MVPYDEGVTVVMKVSVPGEEGAGVWDLLIDMKSFNSNGSVYQADEYMFTFTVE